MALTQKINKMYKNCDITHRCVGVDPPRAAPGLPIPPTLLLLRWRAAERALVSDEEEDCEDDDQEDEDNLDAKPFLPHLLLLTQETWPFSWMMMMMMRRRTRIVMKMAMVMTLLFLHGVATVLLLQ